MQKNNARKNRYRIMMHKNWIIIKENIIIMQKIVETIVNKPINNAEN